MIFFYPATRFPSPVSTENKHPYAFMYMPQIILKSAQFRNFDFPFLLGMADVYIGTSTGLLKKINLAENSYENLNSVESLNRSQEIVSLTWVNTRDDGDETELLCALVNKQLKLYDAVSSTFTDMFTVDGDQSKICGLEILPDASVLTCVESGFVQLWSFDGSRKIETDISVGSNVCRMRKSPHKANIFATGGKENPLKIWDLNNPTSPLFSSKNVNDVLKKVKNNWLNLRTPIWETDLRFLPDSNSDLVATCTRHHFIRLYDLRASRRPSLQIDWQQDPFTTMSLCYREKQVVAGTNRGFLGLFDLRSPGKLVHSFKGFAGHINCVEAHRTQPYIASCGLDRFFRLHNLDNKKLLNKIYCKSHLNTLLMKKRLSILTNVDDILEEKRLDDTSKINSDSDEADLANDEVWSAMKKVGKKRNVPPTNELGETTDQKPNSKRFKQIEKRNLSDDEENVLTSKKRRKLKKNVLADRKRKADSDSDSRKSPSDCTTGLKSKLKARKKISSNFDASAKRKVHDLDSTKMNRKRLKLAI